MNTPIEGTGRRISLKRRGLSPAFPIVVDVGRTAVGWDCAACIAFWHAGSRATSMTERNIVPPYGLFRERQNGASIPYHARSSGRGAPHAWQRNDLRALYREM